jgi:hypothetical protein
MNLLSLFGQTSNDMYSVDTANAVTNAILIGLPILFGLTLLIGYILIAFLLSRIFTKAGVAAWKAWVPGYNMWITYELGDQKGWWAVLYLLASISPSFITLPNYGDSMFWPALLFMLIGIAVGITATVYLYIAMYRIGLKFGKEGYFVLWAIFLPLVWYAWLAFDKSTWNPTLATPHTPTAPTYKSDNTDAPTKNV